MKNILLFFFLLSQMFCFAQNENDNKGRAFLAGVHYGFQIPAADLAERFGQSNGIGIGLDFLTKKNFIIGATGAFHFGITVKEDVISNLRGNDGTIIGRDMGIASLVLRQRGLYFGGHIGKLFPLSKNNRSGIRFTLGSGFYQHWIRVQDDFDSVPQVAGAYQKGYDRLSNGFALTQFLGYQLLSESRRINMYIGVEVLEAFTQNRRAFNYNTMTSATDNRMDMMFALKVGWTILPIFLDEDEGEIYY